MQVIRHLLHVGFLDEICMFGALTFTLGFLFGLTMIARIYRIDRND